MSGVTKIMQIYEEERGMRDTNEMEIQFLTANPANEGFARVAVAAFLTQMNPTVEEVADVKTAVSEAVTNAIIHGYEEAEVRKDPYLLSGSWKRSDYSSGSIRIKGIGILKMLKQAMQPTVYDKTGR